MLQTPGINIYLDGIFREKQLDDRIAPLTVMLIDELEQLLPQIRGGDITWQQLFAERFAGNRVADVPIHTTLVDMAVERRFRRRGETFLAKQAEILVAMIKDAYRDLL